jgi:hypothetical protein
MAARIGERRVGRARTRELGIQLDAAADVDDDDERRPSLGRRKGTRVAFGLAACAQQRFVETACAADTTHLLRFEHERAAPVQVDATGAGAAVAVHERDRALEHVVPFGGRMWRVDTKQEAQVEQEALRGR